MYSARDNGGHCKVCLTLIFRVNYGSQATYVCETWVKTDDPPAIRDSPAPPGYRITHVHRDNPDRTRGGGLAVIHRDTIDV